jgi:peptidoglycan-associated lipoprotein
MRSSVTTLNPPKIKGIEKLISGNGLGMGCRRQTPNLILHGEFPMYKSLRCWVLVTVALATLAGCSSTATREGAAEVSDQSTGGGAAYTTDGSGTSTSAAREGAGWYGDPLEDPNSPLATRIIYFDYDQSTVRMEYLDLVRAHAQYLAINPQVTVRLEGHADERGSREYNLGLGEKRANAIRNLMMAEGVADKQLAVVSYGEERPTAYEHNEEAWAMNRRVELVY